MHRNIRSNSIKNIQYLLEHGIDVEIRDIFGYTPLIHASACGHIGIVKLLLKHGANIEGKDSIGITSICHASSQGNIDIVRLLLEYGANIEAKTPFNTTSLHYASRCGHTDTVKLLLDHGVNPLVKNKYGNTAKQITQKLSIIQVLECHEHMIQLKEWRPWNHHNYSHCYRKAMETLVVIAKC